MPFYDFDDNTVIPSFLGVSYRGGVGVNSNQNSSSLRVGEVKEVVYPDDNRSLSGKYVEYTVEVTQRDSGSTSSSTLYHGCVISSLFGGFADKVQFTLRSDTKDSQNNNESGGVGVGSKVLILCINGDRNQSVIVGGLPDSQYIKEDKVNYSKDLGHNLQFEFNGVNFSVNKDGELKVKFRGATKVDGDLTDNAVADAEGSCIEINKEGNLKLATPEDDQFLLIDHKNKKIELQAQKQWDCNIKGTVNITADEKVNIKSTGVMIGDATDAFMLGTTYRNAESNSNGTLSTDLIALATIMGVAGTSLTSAAALNAIPIVGPASAATLFATTGAMLINAATKFGSSGGAIKAMEAQAPTFLSVKNKND